MPEKPAKTETPRASPLTGLSGKVLLLTMVFVMLGEVLIFLPSIANFRIQWFKTRIAQAEIAALAAEAAPDQILNDDLRSEILMGAGVAAVSLKKGEKRQLVLRDSNLAMIAETFDLRPGMYYNTIFQALAAMVRTEDRIVGVELAVDAQPQMLGRSGRADDGTMGEFKSGIYYLAKKRPDLELVPVYMENLNRILPRGEYMPVPLLSSITVGAPIWLEAGEPKADFLNRAREAVKNLKGV